MSSSAAVKRSVIAMGVLIAVVLVVAVVAGAAVAVRRSHSSFPKTKRRATKRMTGRNSKKRSKKNVRTAKSSTTTPVGRRQTAEPGRSGADPGRRSPRCRPDGLQIGGRDRRKAKAQNVPVVSYDRLIENGEVDAYVSFDNEKVGELQAETLAKKLKEDGSASGPIIMINGDPADPNAALFKAGAHKGFDAAGVRSRRSTTRPDGRPKTPSARRSRRSPRSGTTASKASTRPTTNRRRRDRGAEGRRDQP